MNQRSGRERAGWVGVAVVALVVGLSGPAIARSAAHKLDGSSIKPNSITGKQIKESTLGTVPRAKSLPPLVWHKMALNGDWVAANGGPAPEYSIDAQGVVRLRGAIHNGDSDPVLDDPVRLPHSALPANDVTLPIAVAGGEDDQITVGTDGTITFAGSTDESNDLIATTTYLDSVSWVAK